MGRTELIQADGKSPLSQYISVLVRVPDTLEQLLSRDAEAVRILSTTPALPEALRRADRWYWDRQREKQSGEVVATRRGWTRRDEQRVNMQRCLRSGGQPTCRAATYLAWIEPRNGPSLHDRWFRLAVEESRRDGTAAVLCPKLAESKTAYERLLTAARSISQDDGGDADFQNARLNVGTIACELMGWAKSPTATEPLPDGPCHPETWRNGGEVVNDTLQSAAWLMVNFLWACDGRSATFDALKIPVYEDQEHDADRNAFGSLRRAANNFFRDHGIPWRVTISKMLVSLVAKEV